MSRMFEHMIPVFEWEDSIDVLYRTTTVIGNRVYPVSNL